MTTPSNAQNIHAYLAEFDDIPGTRVFTAARARKGYWPQPVRDEPDEARKSGAVEGR